MTQFLSASVIPELQYLWSIIYFQAIYDSLPFRDIEPVYEDQLDKVNLYNQ